MNYIYGREASPNEKVVPLSDVENLLNTLGWELDKRDTTDRAFPVVMRVKGLVDHVRVWWRSSRE